MADFVRGYEASTWYGIVAPKGTSPEVINLLNKGVDSALSDAKFSARLTDLGGAPISGSPAEFAKLIVDETEKWGRVVKFAGAKA
jgi:tripartite-type tricarboxylate transporter receptor subunit TctC